MSLLKQAAAIPAGAKMDDEACGLLVEAALAFRRAGGWLHLLDWCELDTDERAALLAAQVELQAEAASLHGWAAQSPLQAAQAAVPWDGGEMLLDVAFETMRGRLVTAAATAGRAAG